MERQRGYEAIAEVYRDIGLYDYWTPERVAEAELRMAIDDADIPDLAAHFADFALCVLDKLGVWRRTTARATITPPESRPSALGFRGGGARPVAMGRLQADVTVSGLAAARCRRVAGGCWRPRTPELVRVFIRPVHCGIAVFRPPDHRVRPILDEDDPIARREVLWRHAAILHD
jgi:hypothetical protein